MNAKLWWSGLVLGIVASAVLAMVMTYADWRLNPGDIFRSDTGTNWVIVRETLISWFVPTVPAAVILSVADSLSRSTQEVIAEDTHAEHPECQPRWYQDR